VAFTKTITRIVSLRFLKAGPIGLTLKRRTGVSEIDNAPRFFARSFHSITSRPHNQRYFKIKGPRRGHVFGRRQRVWETFEPLDALLASLDA
jgi:hypothetical protein